MRSFLAVSLIILVLVLLDSLARAELYEVREIHYQMGTLLDITLYHSDPKEGKKILRRSVQEVHRLEGILSNYDPQSSLSFLNRHAGLGKVKVERELFHVLAVSVDFSVKTSGYFDVTVGPLVSLWRQAGEKRRMPSPDALAQAVGLVGYRKLRLYDNGEAELVHEEMSIDLGGIGKGYAVDRVVEILKQAGVTRALINFGGSSIYALGGPIGDESWKIGVKGTNGKLVGMVHLRNQALSTSGSMGRYWEIDGRRYGHLIDPKSGWPVTKPRMATVVAETATEGEALTKPLVLLGAADEFRFIKKHFPRVEALVIAENEELAFSGGFSAFFETTKGQ
ncbi:MAG: FAD:protein FMN transferase [Candidatus Binatia bacterium]